MINNQFKRLFTRRGVLGLILASVSAPLILKCIKYANNNKAKDLNEPVFTSKYFKKMRSFYHTKDGLPVLEGYVSKLNSDGKITQGLSASPGEVVRFHLDVKTGVQDTSLQPKIRILDVLGSVVDEISSAQLKRQTKNIEDEPWENGYGFDVSFEWKIPKTLKSGIYVLNVNSNTIMVEGPKRPPLIFVIVKSFVDKPDIMLVQSTNTFNAYSKSIDRSNYNHPIKVHKTSFLRPMNYAKELEWLSGLQWLLQKFNTLNIAHISDFELEDYANIKNTKILILIGHSEYWTRRARKNFDRFVLEGGHAIIASGNTMWWQIRYNEDHSAMTVYKVSGATLQDDPEPNPLLKTSRWSEPTLKYPIYDSIGVSFVDAGFGQIRRPNALSLGGYTFISPGSPLLEGTNLTECKTLPLSKITEFDGVPIVGFDLNGWPIVDRDKFNPQKLEILAYDWTYRNGNGIATFLVFQKTSGSGIVVNYAAKGVLGYAALKDEAAVGPILRITENAVNKLLNGHEVFSANLTSRKMAIQVNKPFEDLPVSFVEKCR